MGAALEQLAGVAAGLGHVADARLLLDDELRVPRHAGGLVGGMLEAGSGDESHNGVWRLEIYPVILALSVVTLRRRHRTLQVEEFGG